MAFVVALFAGQHPAGATELAPSKLIVPVLDRVRVPLLVMPSR